MSITKVNPNLDHENATWVKEKLMEIRELMPFLIELPKHERKSLVKMGSKHYDFVTKCLAESKNQPRFMPTYFTTEEFEHNIQQMNELLGVEQDLKNLLKTVTDTVMKLRADAYTTARTYYNSVKNAAAAGVEGAGGIAGRLSEHHKTPAAAKQNDIDFEDDDPELSTA
ncbi:MAG: hypothetical protein GY765_15040 [bacterium]|nr:hypothetical protein [bacterium]